MSNSKISPSGRVVVIGAGLVGSTIAYSILIREIAKEVILIDIVEPLVNAQVMDMAHATAYNGTRIAVGKYSDIQDGDIVVVTCGQAQKSPTQTRMELIEINTNILKSVIEEINKSNPKIYMMIVTNPNDVLTFIASKLIQNKESIVFGSGTSLDTARLKFYLADKLKLNPTDINAYILGEHGNSSFFALDSARINGFKISTMWGDIAEHRNEIEEYVRQAAYKIIEGKKATYNGISNTVATLVKSIINNERKVFPLSLPQNGEYDISDVALSVPAVLDSTGARILKGLELSSEENENLKKSAEVIKEVLNEAGY